MKTTIRLSPAIRAAVVLALSGAFRPLALSAASIYPVRFGKAEEVFGSEAAELSKGFSNRKAREFMAFEEGDGKERPEERCFGSASFDESGFVIAFFIEGARKDEPGACGGSLRLALHTSTTNSPGDDAPILLRYTLEEFPPLEPSMPTLGGVNNENNVHHSQPVRYSYETASYGNSRVRVPQHPPEIEFVPLERGWVLSFTFRWVDFIGRIPFAEGRYPTTWRLLAKRTRADGSEAFWGTVRDPVLLSWGRPGDGFVDEVPMYFFTKIKLGKAYRDIASFIRSDWTTYRQEKWIGYLDPGLPTFEKKNPESDDLFFDRQVGPILESNDNIDKAIYFNVDAWTKEYVPKPPVADFSKAERKAIVSSLDRIVYVEELVDQGRRDYLLARFLDEPVAEYVVPAAARPKKLEKLDAGRELSADDLSLDDTGGEGIELDDIAF